MKKKGIYTVLNTNIEQFNRLHRRDAYFDIVNKINRGQSLGHAICIVGLRRTGKTILLNHLHINSPEFGVREDEILHITLSVTIDDRELSRDDFDNRKLTDMTEMRYPSLEELNAFIDDAVSCGKIKCILIDEITLCRDLILGGKGFIDGLVNRGIIVILAGTESASFNLADENSLYTRLMLVDISYIPFGEYCRLKQMHMSTTAQKEQAIRKYIEHGNILDDAVKIDDRYIESALGVNIALSIINSDYAEFMDVEGNIKEFVQSTIKYTKLIGESITLDAIKSEITRADLTRALTNENAYRRLVGYHQIDITKTERTQITVDSVEDAFREYDLSFGISQIPLTKEQLGIIDQLFTKMGLLYDLSLIPEDKFDDGSVRADDLTILHSLLYMIAGAISNRIRAADIGLSDEDSEALAAKIESTAMGRLLEGIVTLEFIKGIEKDHELLVCLKNYGNGKFKTARKCSKHRLYKYNNRIYTQQQVLTAEIDIVIPEQDTIRLIEIKKSTNIDENQVRWLNNDTVINEIKERISRTKRITKEVFYLGEERTVGDICYRNIADVLLKHYHKHFSSEVPVKSY